VGFIVNKKSYRKTQRYSHYHVIRQTGKNTVEVSPILPVRRSAMSIGLHNRPTCYRAPLNHSVLCSVAFSIPCMPPVDYYSCPSYTKKCAYADWATVNGVVLLLAANTIQLYTEVRRSYRSYTALSYVPFNRKPNAASLHSGLRLVGRQATRITS